MARKYNSRNQSWMVYCFAIVMWAAVVPLHLSMAGVLPRPFKHYRVSEKKIVSLWLVVIKTWIIKFYLDMDMSQNWVQVNLFARGYVLELNLKKKSCFALWFCPWIRKKTLFFLHVKFCHNLDNEFFFCTIMWNSITQVILSASSNTQEPGNKSKFVPVVALVFHYIEEVDVGSDCFHLVMSSIRIITNFRLKQTWPINIILST